MTSATASSAGITVLPGFAQLAMQTQRIVVKVTEIAHAAHFGRNHGTEVCYEAG